MLWKILPCPLSTSPLCQYRLRESDHTLLCYNGNLITWTFVSLTTAKFEASYILAQWLSLYRMYQNSMAKLQERIPRIERQKKKGMTTWVRKCMVTELSERVFSESTLTHPDCRNKLWGTRYNFYTSNQVLNKFDVGLNTCKARTHNILSSPVK
jgi:hypothetical protein